MVGCGVFLPQLVSVAWHVIHGSSVAYGQFNVPVPWGWVACLKEDSLVVLRMPSTGFGWATRDVVITPLLYPRDRAFEYEVSKRAHVETQLKRGYELRGEKQVQLVSEQNYCLNFAARNDPEDLWILCDFPGHQISIGLIGKKEDSPVLDSVIRGITIRN